MKNQKPRLKNKNACKRIDQISLSGKFIKTWDSLSEASKKLNINVGNISSCLKEKRTAAGDFLWYYNEDNYK